MTTRLSFALVGLAIPLGGCAAASGVTTGLRAKFEARNEGRTKSYAAPSRPTYEAVQIAAARMGYRFVRGGAAQGELEAVNALATEGSMRSARQIAMKVRLHGIDEKTTEVNVRLTEIIEADSPGRTGIATESPLRDTPQYEVFFRSVQEALDAQNGKKE